jgi:lambda repressor-like predicted transcriptional regulator
VISRAEGRVLEVGMGSGLNLPFDGPRVREISGLEPSARLMAMAALKPSRPVERTVPTAKQVQHRLSPENTAELAAGYKAGATIRQLAQQYRVHRTTVMAILDRHSVPTRYRRLSLEQINEAVELYPQGWSLRKLSERYGTTDNTVRDALLAAGVQTRPRPGCSDANS